VRLCDTLGRFTTVARTSLTGQWRSNDVYAGCGRCSIGKLFRPDWYWAQASSTCDCRRVRTCWIGALGALSLVHWGRKLQFEAPEIVLYSMGVLRTWRAAIAIPFVLLGIWADQKPTATYQAARRRMLSSR